MWCENCLVLWVRDQPGLVRDLLSVDCKGFSKYDADEVSAKYSDGSAMCVMDLLSLLRDPLGVLGLSQ